METDEREMTQEDVQKRAHDLETRKAFQDELTTRFTYHKPTEETVPKYNTLRNAGHGLAGMIEDEVPPCRERDIAIEKLEEVIMWANAGIARRS